MSQKTPGLSIHRMAESDRLFAVFANCLEELVPEGGRILEVGFGRGHSRYESFLRVRGHYGSLDVSVVDDSIEHPSPWAPRGYDQAVAVTMLQRIVDDEHYRAWVSHLFATLKPGGALVVVDHEPVEDPGPDTLPRGYLPILNDPACEGFRHTHVYEGHWVGTFEKRPWVGEVGEAPVIERAGDEAILAEGSAMPDVLVISSELLGLAGDSRLRMTRDVDTVEIRLANGRWVYAIVGWRRRQSEAVCEIRYREEGDGR